MDANSGGGLSIRVGRVRFQRGLSGEPNGDPSPRSCSSGLFPFRVTPIYSDAAMTIIRHISSVRISSALCAGIALAALVLSSPGVVAQEKPTAANPGLVGLLSPEAPYELTEESMESLDGKWAPVRARISSLVEKLHSDESLAVVG